MTLEQLQMIMIEKGVTIRAIPKVHKSYWTIPAYTEKWIRRISEKENSNIVYDSNNKETCKYLEEKIEYPKNGGKFIIVSNCGSGAMVNFNNHKYYDTIEEAIKTLIN